MATNADDLQSIQLDEEQDNDDDDDDEEETDELLINGNNYDEKCDLEEDKQTFVGSFDELRSVGVVSRLAFSLKKMKEAKLDEEFPDEIDTPMDVAARVRFQK
jgi:pre-rRNA-processing protein TSR1